jgi:hypothetical protein
MAGGNSKQRRRMHRLQKSAEATINRENIQQPDITVRAPLQQNTTPAEPKNTRAQRFLSRWQNRLGTLATVFAILTTFFSFFPRLTVSEPFQMNSSNFFSYKVDIKNDGILPVFGVRCGVAFKKITNEGTGQGFLGSEQGMGTQLMSTADMIGTLSPGDAYSFTTEPLLGMLQFKRVGDADFAIVISYVPILPPIRMNKCVHFKAYTDSGGTQHWFRSSSGHCNKADWFDYRKPQQPK